MSILKWEDERGFRWLVGEDGIPCPSVTSVLSSFHGMDDMGWYDLPKARREMILSAAANTGNEVHDLIHDVIAGQDPVIPGIWKGPFEKFRLFLEKKKGKSILAEEAMIHPSYHFGGSADEVVETVDGIELWDIKSGKKWIKHAQQVAAYKVLIEANRKDIKIDKLCLLYVNVREGWFEASYLRNIIPCELQFLRKLDAFKFDNHTILSGKRQKGGVGDTEGNIYKWPVEEVFKSAYDMHIKHNDDLRTKFLNELQMFEEHKNNLLKGT